MSGEQDTVARKEALKARAADMAKREVELNKGRSDETIGRRSFLGMTRGKGTTEIQYKAWDESLPKTLPTTLQYFIDELKDEAKLVQRLILGDNELSYQEASDPIAEFVSAFWPEDIQKQYRLVVRNYALMNDVTIEEAATQMKPNLDKKYAPKA